MKRQMATLLPLCLLILVLSSNQVFVAKGNGGDSTPPRLIETVGVVVNCTTAHVDTSSLITSNDTSLIHFPSGVNMNDAVLEKATAVSLVFSTVQSFLVFQFNNTDAGTARSIADSVTPSITTAFDTAFTWNSTGTRDSYVNVTYIGGGKSNLTSYTQWLMSQCLASDLGGFSLTFLPMTSEPGAFTSVFASKESGGFEWEYSMMVSYCKQIPSGSDSHTIDILDLLNVDSLAPSSYANVTGTYVSIVILQILSDETVSYISCQPGLANPPSQLRGWYYTQFFPSTLTAYFNFADDPTPVSQLSFTFSGTVIPEFSTPLILLLFMVTTLLTIIVYRKKLPLHRLRKSYL